MFLVAIYVVFKIIFIAFMLVYLLAIQNYAYKLGGRVNV